MARELLPIVGAYFRGPQFGFMGSPPIGGFVDPANIKGPEPIGAGSAAVKPLTLYDGAEVMTGREHGA